jgi:hypothetical protein
MMPYKEVGALTLKAGDTVLYRYRMDGTPEIRCSILGERTDNIELPGHRTNKWWARREDKGQEGWIIYGDAAIVKIEVP